MRVATWNVNNVVKRLDLLLDWLARARPDVVALQELKTPGADFPGEALREAGYTSLVVGQRTWNGVALLARGHEPLPVVTALPGDPQDKEARYVEAAINGVLFGCLYLPNGNPQPGPKFDYKLRWFERMRQRAAALWASGQPVVLLGDWNVVPTDDDIYKPDTWRTDALLQPAVREAYAAVLAQGWTDALASAHPAERHFTFWDYRRKRWERNAGLRIDHILVSAGLQIVDAGVDREERGREGASDHAPVWAEIRQARAAPAAGSNGKKSKKSKESTAGETSETSETSKTSKTSTASTASTASKTGKAGTAIKGAVVAAGAGSAPASPRRRAPELASAAASAAAAASASASASAAAPASASAAASAPAPAVGPPPATARADAAAATPAPLARYNAKRDFSKTAEPAGTATSAAQHGDALVFVVQKHWASRLHYDFRLELDGVMLSWAVPKGPSFDPAAKQMAIHVEDHPVNYNSFEGEIPKKEYGGGTVIVWDRGTWEPVGDPRDGLANGKLLFKLHGQKLAGLWELVRISKPGQKKQDQWLLFKKRGDAWARPGTEYDVISALPDSVVAKPLGLVEEREPRRAAAARPSRGTPDDLPALLAQGRKAALPAKLAPQLATLVSAVAPGDWVVETKFDGYRLLARVDGEDVRLFTRNGHDWTHKLRPVADAVQALGLDRAWLDAEIVVLNDAGVPDFNRLQNAIDSATTHDIVMFAFDLPFFGGRDLRQVPLASRREVLRQLLDERASEKIRFSESFDAVPGAMLSAACQMGLEGVIVKRADAPYASGRTETWMKLKCQHRQEFVVVGFTDRAGAGREVGGLLLGYHEAGALRFAGTVGTGWGASTGRELHDLLSKLVVAKPSVDPADAKPGRWSHRSAGSEHWVKPVTVVEVAFAEWTPDRRVRHAVFRGLRTDKPATQIVRERAKTPAGATPSPPRPARAKPRASTVKITNPERVIDPTTGLRKIDLVRYYESIAEWMLPHLKNRPVSLVRAPTGITGELFYQKHPETKMPGMKELDAALWPGHAALLSVDSAESLVVAAQMNVVEFHTWNSRTNHIDQPDRFILDLDPGEGVTWPMLQEAAVLTRAMLEELGLACWLKTSGGKGLHVVVPLTPKLDYAEVKTFSQAVVRHMAKVIPSRFVAVMGGGNRVGKIFIDYLRNGHGQTTACAFSARSRPGMGVSMPVGWDQLAELKGGAQWSISTAREYLSFQQQDPWSGYWKKRQTLRAAMKLLA